jgi:hypothetical protein
MDRDTVECMSKVAGALSLVKKKVAEKLRPENLTAYMEIRDLLCDCQEMLALHCDTAPIKLIAGRVDEIMGNLEFSKKTVLQGD